MDYSMATTSKKGKITLSTNDGKVFELETAVAEMSGLLRHMIEDGCIEGIIPLPNVNAKTLNKILEYCNKHANNNDPSDEIIEELKAWDDAYMKANDAMIADILLATNYMDFKGLFNLGCKKLADKMIGKSPDEIRVMFGKINDYTPEEEAEVRKENSWAFEETDD